MLSLADLFQPPYGSVKEAVEKSTKEFAYVAAEDGLYRVFKAGGPHAPLEYIIVTKVMEAPSLRKVQPGFFIQRIEVIPKTLLARCASIFRMRFDRHKSEMIVILKWNEERKEYFLDRVKFGVVGPGYLRYCYDGERCGTIHSHGGIHACFSHTDDGDDENKPGIHIVMGDFNQDDVSVVSSITGAGERLNLRNSGLEDWMYRFTITEDEYAWFNENVLSIEEVQAKSDGYYIVEKGSRKVAFWTKTREEAEALIDPFFEIEKVEKKDRTRFYHEDSREEQEERRQRPKRKEKDLVVSSQEAAVAGLSKFILDNDLLYNFADTFGSMASMEKTEELIEHLEGNLSFVIDSKKVKQEAEEEDEAAWHSSTQSGSDFPPGERGKEITDPDELAIINGTGDEDDTDICLYCGEKDCDGDTCMEDD